jgi:hypothetical protein
VTAYCRGLRFLGVFGMLFDFFFRKKSEKAVMPYNCIFKLLQIYNYMALYCGCKNAMLCFLALDAERIGLLLSFTL